MAVQSRNIPAPDRVPVKRALLSVSDKTGLVEFARALAGLGVTLLSTGGTAKVLKDAGLDVTDVSDITGFPEIMDGRVKTLHPKVHGGLLAIRDEPEHRAAMDVHGIEPIDLLVVNLYPFETVRTSGADRAAMVENIDIGGPAMLRAAAKNHAYVAVATDTADYAEVLATLDETGGATTLALRQALAARTFARTAAYDAAIAAYLAPDDQAAPRHFSLAGKASCNPLRYGENPHQQAALFLTGETRPGVATARQLQGKTLSYNNLNDTDAAFELVAEFDPARSTAVAIIKHANPCGVGLGPDLVSAYARALACDPVSAFGGIVALNRRLDAIAAAEIVKTFTEVIIAPDTDDEAVAIVAAKKNLRLLVTGGLPDPRAPGMAVRSIAGGLLVQSRDNSLADDLDLRTVTKREPSAQEHADLVFAFKVAKHVKSNAIVYARDGATIGIGAGQMSRVDSSRIAARKAEDAGLPTVGSVVASDAFFPFADGLHAAIEAGATAVIQPGGSMRDDEVIALADEHGLAMIFTGTRHFRH